MKESSYSVQRESRSVTPEESSRRMTLGVDDMVRCGGVGSVSQYHIKRWIGEVFREGFVVCFLNASVINSLPWRVK